MDNIPIDNVAYLWRAPNHSLDIEETSILEYIVHFIARIDVLVQILFVAVGIEKLDRNSFWQEKRRDLDKFSQCPLHGLLVLIHRETII